MSRRINIILPEETIAVLDRVAPKGSRSRFVSEAVLQYVKERRRRNLRERLRSGYLANADQSLKIAAEWFPLEEEAWRVSQAPAGRAKK